ncbi:oocyte-secreted protein 2 [Chlorocebus sabaeus]|uniref:oocyte-secreted protein 2 n=1 Tax=Chlorocebus sabaeus TaxID=60711 RepID=UPI0018B0CACB|nr:oocyte-secreted protein 2 [Chlorocebus sabaeus]
MPYKNHLNQSPLLVSGVVLCWRSAQMVSMALEVLMLLALLIWTGAENLHVKINCSLDWLMVSVIPLAESRNLYIFADELHLGMGCPANWIHTYVYEFIYLVHDCGIRTRVISEETLLFQTELYFTPRNIDHNPEEIHLECSASRKSVWLTPVSTENEIKLDPSPFIADFQTTAEELGLLSSSQTCSELNEKWKLEAGIMYFAGKQFCFFIAKI